MFWLKLMMLAAMLLGRLPQNAPTGPPPAADSTLAPNEFRLNNGDVFRGKFASPNEDGVVIELETGGFSERIPWAKFTQETLKRFANIRETARFATRYVEVAPEIRARFKARQAQKRTSFVPKQAAKVDLPAPHTEFIATVTTPFNLAVLAFLYLGNLYAAYEIAVFRNRPFTLVCGVSAVLPGVGPLIFLSLPGQEVVYEEPGSAPAMNVPDHAPAKHADVSSSLSVAKQDKGQPTGLQPATYTRGDTTFNRRFFETRFAGFFRVVLGEAEKAMIIVIKTPRDEYFAQRIARITANEVHVQLLRGGEFGITIGEITQVQLRPKDAQS